MALPFRLRYEKLPRRVRSTRRARSSTFTCLETAASDISNGLATTLIGRSWRVSVFKIARRVGSLRAWKIRSRSYAPDSTIWLNLDRALARVNRLVESNAAHAEGTRSTEPERCKTRQTQKRVSENP